MWVRLVHLAVRTLSPLAASLAALSALSFPSTPQWLGTHLIIMMCPYFKSCPAFWYICTFKACPALLSQLFKLLIIVCESQKILIFWGSSICWAFCSATLYRATSTRLSSRWASQFMWRVPTRVASRLYISFPLDEDSVHAERKGKRIQVGVTSRPYVSFPSRWDQFCRLRQGVVKKDLGLKDLARAKVSTKQFWLMLHPRLQQDSRFTYFEAQEMLSNRVILWQGQKGLVKDSEVEKGGSIWDETAAPTLCCSGGSSTISSKYLTSRMHCSRGQEQSWGWLKIGKAPRPKHKPIFYPIGQVSWVSWPDSKLAR